MAHLLYHHSVFLAKRIIDKVDIPKDLQDRLTVWPYAEGDLHGLMIRYRPSSWASDSARCIVIVAKHLEDDTVMVISEDGHSQQWATATPNVIGMAAAAVQNAILRVVEQVGSQGSGSGI